MTHIKALADENIVAILEYLRATDLATVREVDKEIFHKSRVSTAVKFQIEHIYNVTFSPMAEKRHVNIPGSPIGSPGYGNYDFGCDLLYVREIKSILTALTSPVPMNGKGYWVSTSWVANAKKYFEALNLPDIAGGRKAGAKKMSKIRQRRGSDSLPPWPSMNADIVCTHQNLAVAKSSRAKRRLIDGKYWHFLRKFYPVGPEFKSRTIDCCFCCARDDEKKASAILKIEEGLRVRRFGCLSGPLESVSLRRNGVPSHLLYQKTPIVSPSDSWDDFTYPETVAKTLNLSVEEDVPFQAALLDSLISSSTFTNHLSLPPSPSPPPLPSPLSLSLEPIPVPVPVPCARSSTLLSTRPSTLPSSAVFTIPTSGTSSYECSPPLPPESTIATIPQFQPLASTPVTSSAGWSQPLASTPVTSSGWSQPLLPGLYNLVPRSWLRSWRVYNKDLSVSYVPPLDCTSMLCQSHGYLVVPCHVNEYLIGLKRTLLGGLGSYDGDIVEILSAEEWDALQSTLNSLSDFNVRFCLDGENILWNTRICQVCSSDSFFPASQTQFSSVKVPSRKWSTSK